MASYVGAPGPLRIVGLWQITAGTATRDRHTGVGLLPICDAVGQATRLLTKRTARKALTVIGPLGTVESTAPRVMNRLGGASTSYVILRRAGCRPAGARSAARPRRSLICVRLCLSRSAATRARPRDQSATLPYQTVRTATGRCVRANSSPGRGGPRRHWAATFQQQRWWVIAIVGPIVRRRFALLTERLVRRSSAAEALTMSRAT